MKCCGLKGAAMKVVGIHKIRMLCLVHCYTNSKINDLENVTTGSYITIHIKIRNR
jgi:hypothetical protein